MMHPAADIRTLLQPGKRVHLAGIGGVSMCALAEVLQGMGLVVQGSDMTESDTVRHLRSLGIQVAIGHSAENLKNCDAVIRTAAIHDSNPEIAGAIARGIPVYERAQAWGGIMQGYRNALCVSGTHGKTTTTSMATHIFMAAQKDPTVMIGGTLPLLHAGYRVGRGDTIILESCEYCNSFLNFFPTVAVILNVHADHLDFFKDLADIKNSFREFALRTPEDGCVVVNADDANSMDAVKDIDRKVITFGLTPEADVYAENVRYVGANSEFDIMYKGRLFTDVTLHVPGVHNVKNALAATAACICLGVRPLAVKYGLAGFNGAGRRFEFKGKFNGAEIYDDYAHHPGELKALLDTVETLNYQRTILAFQPHTYSRTAALFDDFVEQLKRPDVLMLAEIFAAREKNTIGISSADLADKIENSFYFPTFDELEAALRVSARPGDIILTVGAGDIYKVGERLVK